MPGVRGPLGAVPGLFWDEARQRYFRKVGAQGSGAEASRNSDRAAQGSGLREGATEDEPSVKDVPVDQAVMQGLREITLKAKRRRKAKEAQMQQTECCVCLEHLQHGERVLQLPCSHLFHKHCLKPWMQQRGSCPNCRAPVDAAFHAAQAAAHASLDA